MGECVATKMSFKHASVHLDGLLGFNRHIGYAVQKQNKFCGLTDRTRHFMTTDALR